MPVKEITAEAPIIVERTGDGCVVRIPGDKPPIGALVFVWLMTCFGGFLVLLSGYFSIFVLLLLLVSWFTYSAVKKHAQEKRIVIENGRLQALGKSFLISDISRVELGNPYANTALMRHEGSIIIGNGLGVGVAAGIAAGQTAMVGGMNLVVGSAAKKAYFVRIEYGTKSYYLAKELREPKARALYAFLTSPATPASAEVH